MEKRGVVDPASTPDPGREARDRGREPESPRGRVERLDEDFAKRAADRVRDGLRR